MTDYEKDLAQYEFEANNTYYGQQNPKPNPKDYDEYGYKKGSVKYEDNLILDPYLIQMYGIQYAKEHPLKKL